MIFYVKCIFFFFSQNKHITTKNCIIFVDMQGIFKSQDQKLNCLSEKCICLYLIMTFKVYDIPHYMCFLLICCHSGSEYLWSFFISVYSLSNFQQIGYFHMVQFFFFLVLIKEIKTIPGLRAPLLLKCLSKSILSVVFEYLFSIRYQKQNSKPKMNYNFSH